MQIVIYKRMENQYRERVSFIGVTVRNIVFLVENLWIFTGAYRINIILCEFLSIQPVGALGDYSCVAFIYLLCEGEKG